MSIQYHVYANAGRNGPVNLTAPVATVAGTSWTSPMLGAAADTTWLVRAFDTVTGYEDLNGDARVRVILDDAGDDVTGQPLAPIAVSASARSGGQARVSWRSNPGVSGGKPCGYHIYIGTPTVNYAAPAATVAANGDHGRAYSAMVSGLIDGTAYQVGVRAFNAVAEESNATVVSVVGMTSGPAPVGSFAVSVGP